VDRHQPETRAVSYGQIKYNSQHTIVYSVWQRQHNLSGLQEHRIPARMLNKPGNGNVLRVKHREPPSRFHLPPRITWIRSKRRAVLRPMTRLSCS
jgi:hypothetical protein